MVKHSAERVVATSADAGVDALVAHAGAVARALGADDALGPAAGRGRVARGAGRARAHGRVARHRAQRARAARGRRAGGCWSKQIVNQYHFVKKSRFVFVPDVINSYLAL